MRIEGLGEEGYFLWEMAESYLHINGQVCKVDHINGSNLYLNELDPSFSYVCTILKVISWVTVVLPVAALAICAFYRTSFNFVEIMDREAFKQMAMEKIAARNEEFFDYAKWAKEARKNPVTDAEVRRLLPQYLSSPENYAANLEPLTRIIFSALARIAHKDCPEEDLALAKFVYKALSQFFMQSEKGFRGRRGRFLAVYHVPFSVAAPVADRELHSLASFLTRHLRKRIKLLQKEEAVKKRIAEAGLDCSAMPLLSLSWLHGTKLSALKNACRSTNRKLYPTGKLQKRQLVPMTGEMNAGVGVGGYNLSSLSGVNLLNAGMAIMYANAFRLDLDREKGSIEAFLSSTVLEKSGGSYSYTWNTEAMAATLTAIRRVASCDAAWFEGQMEAISQKLNEIDQKIEKVFEEHPDVIFNPGDDLFHMSQIKAMLDAVGEIGEILETPPAPIRMEQEDLDWSKIPVVVASSDHYGVPVDLERPQTKEEELYPGSLSLGTDISTVFTTDEHLDTVRTFFANQGLGSVAVEPIGLLETAAKVDNALGDYYYDVLYKKQTAGAI